MTPGRRRGSAATPGASATPSGTTPTRTRQAAQVDIQLLAEKVYALFLAEARRGQTHGARRTPRARG